MNHVKRVISGAVCLSMTTAIVGCTIPRGAATRHEIVKKEKNGEATYQIVEVTRKNTPILARWPVTGWSGAYHWFAADRGPDSSVIETGDTIQVVVWDNQENSLLSTATSRSTPIPMLQVSSSGSIFMPYVGDVQVRGLTADTARKRIQDKLANIAPTAQVQLEVKQGRNNSVDLVGGVSSPGTYPLEARNTRILSLLAHGGGIRPDLRHPLLRLQRNGQIYETRAEDLLADARRNVRVRGGDQIVVVEDDRTFNVLGAAGKQSVMYFEKEHMSAMEAVSAMGGLNSGRANPKGILILREYRPDDVQPGMMTPDKRYVIFNLDLTTADGLFAARNFGINPDDTVLATESPVSNVRTILGLFGLVRSATASVVGLQQL